MLEGTTCGQCGKVLDERTDIDPASRTPCPDCGSTSRAVAKHIQSTIGIHTGLTAKGKRGGVTGRAKWFIETFTGADWSHSLQRFVHKRRTIDRDNDRYAEKVVDPATGEVLHDVEESLSEHWGHGSAKAKKD